MEYVCPLITFARGGRRGRSLEHIYEDDQMVIFIVENFLPFQFQEVCDSKRMTAKYSITSEG